MPTVDAAKTETVKTNLTPDFGNGRYSGMMGELFRDLCAILPESRKGTSVKPEVSVAERIARQFGSDFGAAMATVVASGKVGKSINGDGKITLSEATKAKTTVTDAILIARAVAFANEAGKFGFHRGATEWKLNDQMREVFERFL